MRLWDKLATIVSLWQSHVAADVASNRQRPEETQTVQSTTCVDLRFHFRWKVRTRSVKLDDRTVVLCSAKRTFLRPAGSRFCRISRTSLWRSSDKQTSPFKLSPPCPSLSRRAWRQSDCSPNSPPAPLQLDGDSPKLVDVDSSDEDMRLPRGKLQRWKIHRRGGYKRRLFPFKTIWTCRWRCAVIVNTPQFRNRS